MNSLTSFRNHFSVPENFRYLNAGTMSLTPRSVLQAAADFKDEIESNPAHALLSAWGKLWSVQKELARFFNADPKDLFLRTNVTYAMNDFLMAVQLPPHSEILVSSLEYGAIVNICRWKAEIEGHELRTFHIPAKGPEPLSEAALLAQLEREITPRTKLMLLSHVATANGFILPIEKVAEICRAKGAILAVDGAHGAGSLPLDFGKTNVDFYGSNLHKWMLGPKGTGFGWVAPRVKALLKPRFAGWTTYELAPIFAAFAEGDPWACRWMISSTHGFSEFFAIPEILRFWNDHGAQAIMNRQTELRDYMVRKIGSLPGWKNSGSFSPEQSGPMVAFQLPPKLSQKGFDLMFDLREKHGIQISMTQVDGEWLMRIAPHIYNSEDEIDQAADILAKL